MSCNSCKKGCNKTEMHCPLCALPMHKVLTEEVYKILKKTVTPYVHGTHFHLCDNEACEVVFYSSEREEMILAQDINKSAVHQKKSGQ